MTQPSEQPAKAQSRLIELGIFKMSQGGEREVNEAGAVFHSGEDYPSQEAGSPDSVDQ